MRVMTGYLEGGSNTICQPHHWSLAAHRPRCWVNDKAHLRNPKECISVLHSPLSAPLRPVKAQTFHYLSCVALKVWLFFAPRQPAFLFHIQELQLLKC